MDPNSPGAFELNDTSLRAAYGCHPTGVVGICALADKRPRGMVVSSFVPVSLRPPLVSFCVQHSSTTWPHLRTSPRLGLSVLGARQEKIATRLAGPTERRFDGLTTSDSYGGALAIDGSVSFLNCSLEQEVPAGDHLIVLLRIHSLRARPSSPPIIFHGSRYRTVRELC
ncbi:flavin reductase family protein [Pseudonocardia dioxanivorans]|uniref:flavin reductase family protein n=2 Tax=Pseudonocardia TaxID=1847 RepID=UPI00389A3F43